MQDFAAMHADTHGVGFRVDVPSDWLSANNIETWPGMTDDQLEYVIPRELLTSSISSRGAHGVLGSCSDGEV